MQRDHPALLEHDGEPGADEEGGDVVIVTPEGFDALFKRIAGVRGYPEAGIAVLVDGRDANLHCRHEGDGTMAVHAGTGATPPVLAGREREQEVLNGCLARMAGGRSPPHDVVLAGTPGLLAHLGKMNASFRDRLGSGLLGIGRLGNAAAREALVEPLAAHGASIDAGALDAVVAHSQCYAYFIQLRAWSTAKARSGTPCCLRRCAGLCSRRIRPVTSRLPPPAMRRFWQSRLNRRP